MTHITLLRLTFIACLIAACNPNHPTLDDIVIDDVITAEAEDLLNDDQNNLEIEKDAADGIVASTNPSNIASSTSAEDYLVIPEHLIQPSLDDSVSSNESLPSKGYDNKPVQDKTDTVKQEKVNHKDTLTTSSLTPTQKEKISHKDTLTTSDSAHAITFSERTSTIRFSNSPSTPLFFSPNTFAMHVLGFDKNNQHILPEAITYHKEIMDMKTSYEERNLSKMRQWSAQHLSSLTKPDEVLFYPFGGPDVVNMLTFFPNQSTYVMMGLEHVGTHETVLDWQKPLTKGRMDTLLKSVESVFIRSFFRTLDMSSDFSKNGTRGVLPGMLCMLKLLGKDIKSVQWVTLDPDGSMRYLNASETKVLQTNFGIEITIAHASKTYDQKIYYFKTDLSDDALSSNIALKTLIDQRLGTPMTLVKSASCLMHMKDFSWMRKTLLTISKAVLQDDTGIPFRYYKPGQWKYHLYGQYLGPYGESFSQFKQDDLIEAYEKAPLNPLNFNIGYGYAKIPAHLMLFIRK